MMIMDRVTYLQSISGIKYPDMIVTFYDQFLALKSLLEYGSGVSVSNITVTRSDLQNNSINFSVECNTIYDFNDIIDLVNNKLHGIIYIYGREIAINIRRVLDNKIYMSIK